VFLPLSLRQGIPKPYWTATLDSEGQFSGYYLREILYDFLTALKIMRELRWMTELSAIDSEIGSIFSAAEVSSSLFECTMHLTSGKVQIPTAPVA